MEYDEVPAIPLFKKGIANREEDLLLNEEINTEYEFRDIPVPLLLTHANWKARKTGLDIIYENPIVYKRPFLESLISFSTENNASVQDSLLETLVSVLNVLGDHEITTVTEGFLKFIIERGLIGRPKSVNSSSKILIFLVQNAHHETVISSLISGLHHKSPKNRLASLEQLSILVQNFGVRFFSMKEIFHSVVPLFTDPNPKIRKECLQLCCCCYRYMGEHLKPLLTDLRDVQLSELEKLFEEEEVGVNPPQIIKGLEESYFQESRSRNNTDISAKNDFLGLRNSESIEFPVVSKIPRTFYMTVLNKTLKWQDRAEPVQRVLLPLLSRTSFRSQDDYYELSNCIRELLIDPQAPLMLLGFRCLQELARGLGSHFAPYARLFQSPLFEKLKDKKSSVIEHVRQSLECLLRHNCTTLDQCHDEIESCINSRVPNQRYAIIVWLTSLLQKLDKTQFYRLCRSHNLITKLINDEKAENREAAIQLLNALISACGEKLLQPVLNQLDPKQLIKLQHLSSSINSNEEITISTFPPSHATKAPRREHLIATGGSSTMIPNHSCATSSYHTREVTPSTLGQHIDPISLDSSLLSKEDAFQRIFQLVHDSESILNLLKSKEWLVRREGVSRLYHQVSEFSSQELETLVEPFHVYFLSINLWKESNFQVLNDLLRFFNFLLEKVTTITPSFACSFLTYLTPKLTEQKNTILIETVFKSITTHMGPRFTMKYLMSASSRQRNQKLFAEINQFFLNLVHQFPDSPFDIQALVDFSKTTCFDANVTLLRPSCLALLAALRRYHGSRVDTLMTNVNPSIRLAYETECRKYSSLSDSQHSIHSEISRYGSLTPLRRSRIDKTTFGTGSQAPDNTIVRRSSLARRLHNPSIELASDRVTYPRKGTCVESNMDLSTQLSTLIKTLAQDTEWRQRQTAVKKIEDLFTQHGKDVSPVMINDVLNALKNHIDDTNKNISVDVLRTIFVIIQIADPIATKRVLRNIIPMVLGMVGDQKIALREEATRICHLGAHYLKIDMMLPMLHKPLSSEIILCRQVALEIMEELLEMLQTPVVSRVLLQHILPLVIRLLVDRIGDIRSASERVVSLVAPIVGNDSIYRATNAMKPADQQVIRKALERLIPAQGIGTSPSRPPSLTSGTFSNENGNGSGSKPIRGSRELISNQTGLSSSGTMARGLSPSNMIKRPLPPTRLSGHENNESSSSIRVSNVIEGKSSRITSSSGTSTLSNRAPLFSEQDFLLGMQTCSSYDITRLCDDLIMHFTKGYIKKSSSLMLAISKRLHENITTFDLDCAQSLLKCLATMLDTRVASFECSSETLYRLFGIFFECLLSENISSHKTVLHALNSTTLKVLEGFPVDNVFRALFTRLSDYSTIYLQAPTARNYKNIQIVVKCLMKLDCESVSPQAAVFCSHAYLLQHPPTAFKADCDLTIRTIKTILQGATRMHGQKLLAISIESVGSNNLVTHFIRGCLTKYEEARKRNNESNVAAEEVARRSYQQNNEYDSSGLSSRKQDNIEGRSSLAASTDNLPIGQGSVLEKRTTISSVNIGTSLKPKHVSSIPVRGSTINHCGTPSGRERLSKDVSSDNGKFVADIFKRIRFHTTSVDGLSDLYNYLKEHPDCPHFVTHYNKCSDDFRSFISRNLVKLADKDPNKSSFRFPSVIETANA